jgi:hypothetical protein
LVSARKDCAGFYFRPCFFGSCGACHFGVRGCGEMQFARSGFLYPDALGQIRPTLYAHQDPDNGSQL